MIQVRVWDSVFPTKVSDSVTARVRDMVNAPHSYTTFTIRLRAHTKASIGWAKSPFVKGFLKEKIPHHFSAWFNLILQEQEFSQPCYETMQITKSIICHSLRWLSWLPLWVSSCSTRRPQGIKKSQATKIAAVESSVVRGPMPTTKACTNQNADVQFGSGTWHAGLSESVNQTGWWGFSSSRTCAHNSNC